MVPVAIVMNRLLRPCSWFLVFVALLPLVGEVCLATEPRRVSVTSTADTGPGSLRNAVEQLNADAGGEIDVGLVSGAILLESPLPEVRQNLKIYGPEATAPLLAVDGQGRSSILSIAGGVTCEVARLTFRRGFAGEGRNGAAISNAGGLVLRDCHLEENWTLGGRGGAIFNNGDLRLEGGSLRSNLVEGLAAAVTGGDPGDGNGGAIFQEAGTLLATGTVFAFNRAMGGIGRADFVAPPSGHAAGGAICGSTGRVGLVRCRLEGNSALGGNGGNAMLGAGRGGIARGGALYSRSAVVVLEDCEMQSNMAAGGDGAGAINGWLGEATGNGGDGLGAVVFFEAGRFEALRCLMMSNLCRGGAGSRGKNGGAGAGDYGGVFFGGGGQGEVRQSLLVGNRAVGGLQGSGGRHMGAPGGAWGGAIAAHGGRLTIENCTLSGNAVQGADAYDNSLVGFPGPQPSAAGGAGLAVGAVGGLGSTGDPQVNLRFSTLTENQVLVSRTYVQKPFLPFQTLTNGWVTGGGIHCGGGAVTLEGVICAGNVAATNADVSGPLISRLPNLIGVRGAATGLTDHDWVNVEPRLGPLRDHGGSTWTHALLPGSPALDGIHEGDLPAVDQRGVRRPMGAGWDLGAVESVPQVIGLRFEPGGGTWIDVSSAVGTSMVMESSENLRTWAPLSSGAVGLTYHDPTRGEARFYRLSEFEVAGAASATAP